MNKVLESIKYLNDTCIKFLDRTKELYCTVTFTRKRAEILRDDIAEVNKALQRLEAIDNSNPSEALKLVEELDNCLISDMSIEVDDYDESNYCMSYEYVDFNGEGLQFNDDIKEEIIIDFIREKKISIIKQALLKAQEPKKYLTWENLEKDRTYKALLNGNQYELVKRYDDYEYRCDYITLQKKPNVSIYIYEYEKEIFNDLHLERVEE